MLTMREAIDALGGPTRVAKRLGWPVTTVHYYQRSGRVPHWRRKELERLAKRKKISLPATAK